MCGIAGIFDPEGSAPSRLAREARRMAPLLSHRGPDGAGIFSDRNLALCHTRLSIIDLEEGWQPMENEDGSLWVLFNGEIYNYLELRETLIKKGHTFRTVSDTEVILHLFEEYGLEAALQRMNGQFAIALYRRRVRELLLVRDRFGIRPLYYTRDRKGRFLFASEVKALFEILGTDRPSIDPRGLKEVFTLWTNLPGRTVFEGIEEVPAGSYLIIKGGETTRGRYWEPLFLPDEEKGERDEEYWIEEITSLLLDSSRLRLRADVPVGAYLSGGLDSSGISAFVKRHLPTRLSTFSVAFRDRDFDESLFQREMAAHLGTEHRDVTISGIDIARWLGSAVWHAERPLLRTAPVPMFLLSSLVRDSGFKVVITGEGADELFGGYDLFKEAKIREFWSRDPGSKMRPLLLRRLYPYFTRNIAGTGDFLKAFFREGIERPADPFFSHLPRWRTTGRILDYMRDEISASMKDYSPIEILGSTLPEGFHRWSTLGKAQYLEIVTLLQGYLLSSQGDRMAMAHGIETRFPYLDHRLFELLVRLPDRLKLPFLEEKYILKKVLERLLPEEILKRVKRPYMAPDSRAFFRGEGEAGRRSGSALPDTVMEIMAGEGVKKAGIFEPVRVMGLLRKWGKGGDLGFRENMAFVGILSTQFLHHLFYCESPPPKPPGRDYFRKVALF